MQLESKKYLYDVLQAAKHIEQFCQSKTFTEYETDALLRSAVERQFQIIVEALRQLHTDDPTTAAEISEHARIVAFRNILIHGYAQVDDRIVWDVMQAKLPTLRREVEALLELR